MPQILADRFVDAGTRWLDLATGAPTRVRFAPAGSPRAQLAWADWCAGVSNLRHPLINPLIDYGMAGAARTFEAYAAGHSVAAGSRRGAHLLDHVTAFLRERRVTAPRPVADYLLRAVVAGRGAGGPILGVELQPRPVLEAIREALDAGGPPGTCVVHITGEPRSGLRTLSLAAARAARLAGFVPLSASLLPGPPWLRPVLEDRHICLLVDDERGSGADLAAIVLRLGAASARRHVLLAFGRTPPRGPALVVDRMEFTALTRMLFMDHAASPAREAVFEAARSAAGRPGHLLARLAGELSGSAPRGAALVVHESSPIYGADASLPLTAEPDVHAGAGARAGAEDDAVADAGSGPPGTAAGRRATGAIASMLGRAPERAATLAAAGRHAAALRLLGRAAHVLAARGDREAAAGCALARGHLLLQRARLAAALVSFERVRELAPGSRAGLQAGVGIGVAWTDEGRLVEAEAVLRAAVVAAGQFRAPEHGSDAVTALARCLFWQGRYDEAGAMLRKAADGPAGARPDARTLLLLARVLLAEQSAAAALRTARQGVQEAQAAAPADLPAALRVLAQAAAAAGDPVAALAHVREGLRAARAAHRPLDAVRLRLTALDIQGPGPAQADARRLAARLLAAARGCPPLLRFQAHAVHARVAGLPLDPETVAFVDASGARALVLAPCAGSPNPVADLEAFLSAGQTASDDRAAVERVTDQLRARLRAASVLVTGPDPDRRMLVQSGDAWRGDPVAAWRALASGFSVPLDPRAEPCQAAEPLRFGGEVVGAVAARWVAGAVTDPARAGALLRVAALAIAANVRGLLDRLTPPPVAHPAGEIIGDSAAVRDMREAIVRAARAPFPVLIEGESGSGKELVARAIHRLGPRRDRRFCAINCAALADDLLEAELFGHARGAFTGAVAERAGLFEEADGGTLFLDEIGELSARAQAKLLRVLQDGQVRRVGENHSRKVDVRIVAATNRRLAEEALAGRFRADLRFRLDVVRIEVPPLRERSADVPLLATSFWIDAAARMGTRATLAPEALSALARYDWPGNVRELQNVIAWMAVHSPTRGRITAAAVPAHVAQAAVRGGGTLEAARLAFERRFVKAALASAGGRRSGAAAALGVSRQGLAKMLRRLNLEDDAR